MSILKRRRSADDKGFTLIEATISISIIGLISVVLAQVFTVVVHSTPKTDERIDNAKTLQGLVTWLPQDVDSTPGPNFDESPGASTGCSDNSGVNLLRMEWTETTVSSGIATRYIASYRHVLSDGHYRIKRVTCSGTGPGPFSNSVVRAVSSPLPPLPVGWTQGQAPLVVTVVRSPAPSTDVTLVTFLVTNLDGQVVKVEAAPKNPSESLPTTSGLPVPTTAAPPPTSSTTTTTIAAGPTTTTLFPPPPTTSTLPPTTTTTAPPPCVITGSSISPASVKNTDPNGNGNSATGVGVLASAVTVTVTTTGNCNGLEARATYGAPNGELFHNFTATAGGYTVTFIGYPSSSELWADGARLIQFYSPTGGPYGAVTLDVK